MMADDKPKFKIQQPVPKAILPALKRLQRAGLGLKLAPNGIDQYTPYDRVESVEDNAGPLWCNGLSLSISFEGRAVTLNLPAKHPDMPEPLIPEYFLVEAITWETAIRPWPRTDIWRALRYVFGDDHLLVICHAALEDGFLAKLPAFPSITPPAAQRRKAAAAAAAAIRSALSPKPCRLSIAETTDRAEGPPVKFSFFTHGQIARLFEVILIGLGAETVAAAYRKLHLILMHQQFSTRVFFMDGIRMGSWLNDHEPATSKRSHPVRPTPADTLAPIRAFLPLVEVAFSIKRGTHDIFFDTANLAKLPPRMREDALREFETIVKATTGLSRAAWLKTQTAPRRRTKAPSV